MDGTRFDRWTRRRFGHLAGGAVAALFGWIASAEAGKNGKRRKKKKRCKKLGDPCALGGKRTCCGGLSCDVADPESTSPTVCCQGEGKPCQTSDDCCRGFNCPSGLCELPSSDRALKANFGSVDPADMLARVQNLPIRTWNYTTDDPSLRHIGPMAQDFAALFGVGADDRHIHPIDGQGITLAAIQGLVILLDDLRAENAWLAARIDELE